MTMTDIAYDVDGSTMVGRLRAAGGDGTRPAVLIAHEGNGLDDVQKRRPERFAELGYVAFALDYHGGGEPLASRDEINRRLTMLYEDPDVALRLARLASTCSSPSRASTDPRSPRSVTASAAPSCSTWRAAAPNCGPSSASIPASRPLGRRTRRTSPARC